MKIPKLPSPVPGIPKTPKDEKQVQRWIGKFLRSPMIESTSLTPAGVRDIPLLQHYYQEHLHLIVAAGEAHDQPLNDFDSTLTFLDKTTALEKSTKEHQDEQPESTRKLSIAKDFHEYWSQEHMESHPYLTSFTRDVFMSHRFALIDSMGGEQLDIQQAAEVMDSCFDIVFFYPAQTDKEPTIMSHTWSALLYLGYDIMVKRFFDSLYNNTKIINICGEENIQKLAHLWNKIAEQELSIEKNNAEYTRLMEMWERTQNPAHQKAVEKIESEIVHGQHHKIFLYRDLINMMGSISQKGNDMEQDMLDRLFNTSKGFVGLKIPQWDYDVKDIHKINTQLYHNTDLYAYYKEDFLPNINIKEYYELIMYLRQFIMSSVSWSQYQQQSFLLGPYSPKPTRR